MNPPTNRVRVVLLTQAIGPLDYRLPAGMEAGPGCVVMVPLGPRKLPGVIWDDDVFGDEAVDASKLRPVLELVECPPLGQGLRRLVNWVADYYLTSHAAVLRMVLASSAAFTVSGTIIEYRRTGFEPARLTPQRAAALDALEGAQGLVRELAAEAGVSDAVIRGLIKAGAFEPVTISVDSPLPEPIADFGAPKLNDAQMVAADAMVTAVRSGGFDTFVLDGVTGSGKTETYFEAVAEAIRLGKQVLVLLPEIALTENFLRRFEHRFGTPPVLWHSSLKQSERRRAWRAIVSGDAQVVVGARSALFLPLPELGLIIVDDAGLEMNGDEMNVFWSLIPEPKERVDHLHPNVGFGIVEKRDDIAVSQFDQVVDLAHVLQQLRARTGHLDAVRHALEELRAELQSEGGDAHVVSLDVTTLGSIKSAVAHVETEVGSIDILVNNSGVSTTQRVQDVTEEEFDFTFNTNVKGSFFVAQEVGKRMLARAKGAAPGTYTGGRIINIASVLGLKVLPQVAPYAMSKAAVIQMTKALALEWGRFGINVNAICPGYISTEMNEHMWATEQGQKLVSMLPRKRVGHPHDLDALLVMLASAESSFINGAIISADDGFVL